MKTTVEKLGFTNLQYEMMVFSFYSRWCESVTSNIRQYQEVLANSAINAWFIIELSKQEAKFHEITDQFESAHVNDIRLTYNECTFDMFRLKPTALLDTINKKGTLSITKKGVRVFNQLNNN